MQEMQVQSLGWEDSLKKEMATHFSIFAWEIPWREEPGGLQSMALQTVGYNLSTKQQQQEVISLSLSLSFFFPFLATEYSTWDFSSLIELAPLLRILTMGPQGSPSDSFIFVKQTAQLHKNFTAVTLETCYRKEVCPGNITQAELVLVTGVPCVEGRLTP